MGTIFKKGKNWYIDFYCKGKRLRRKVGPSKELARLALKDVELRIAKGEWLGIVEETRLSFRSTNTCVSASNSTGKGIPTRMRPVFIVSFPRKIAIFPSRPLAI